MATLDDIPTLPPVDAALSQDDMIAVIDSGNRKSPKRASFADIFSYLLALSGNPTDGFTFDTAMGFEGPVTANGGITVTGLTVLVPTFADNSAAIIGGLEDGDIYKTSTGELRVTI